jgi:aryl carrier-like protein
LFGPNSSAAGGRMMQLISLFQAQGFKITFVAQRKTAILW